MESKFLSKFKNLINVFKQQEKNPYVYDDIGMGYSYRPDRPRFTKGTERNIVNAIYNRVAIDCSQIVIKHVKLDDADRYLEDIDSSLNNCLNVEANLDQSGRSFIQDVVISMFDEGVVAILPTDYHRDMKSNRITSIETMRTAKILEWYPEKVKLRAYNDRTGMKEDIMFSKLDVAIIENPLYSVVNEYNSAIKRLVLKLNTLDAIDSQSSSGKLDLIISLPYAIKNQSRMEQAKKRKADIEDQLFNSKYGIAYTDGTEKVTQLNRPVENNLMSQVEYLTNMVYGQLGVTQSILDGTADEKTMLNYYNRTIEPIMGAISEELERKFLSKTARTQKQSVVFFRDPFKLVPINDLAEIADKFTRNAILSSNEMRQIVGMPPSNDPDADELRNKNLNEAVPDRKVEVEETIKTDPNTLKEDLTENAEEL